MAPDNPQPRGSQRISKTSYFLDHKMANQLLPVRLLVKLLQLLLLLLFRNENHAKTTELWKRKSG